MDTWLVVPVKPAGVGKLETWLRLCYEAALAKAKTEKKEAKGKKPAKAGKA